MTPIYLDHNATSPIDPAVLEAMRPHWLEAGNTESRHASGRKARRAWEQARETVAEVLRAEASEVIFTSGGTEANNLAILGLAESAADAPGHLVTSPIEHPAVAAPVERLVSHGWMVDRTPVDAEGRADAASFAAAFRPETRLATLMLANNETGALQPVGELARLAADRGIPVHTDAVQAVGRVPVDFQGFGVTTLAASGHKFHGPPGVGVLLVRKGVRLAPQLGGGGQQAGLRPGTVAVPLAVGLAEALRRWHDEQQARTARWDALRARLVQGLTSSLDPSSVVIQGPADPRRCLPQTLHAGFPGLDGDALLMHLDLAGIAASLGAACASGTTAPSPTLLAMGVPADRLRSSVRFSFGAETTAEQIDEALRRIVAIVARLRAASATGHEP